MSDTKIMPPGQGNPLQPAIIIYIVYAGSFLVPFAAIGGLVYAYVERGNNAVLDTHLDFLIRTFWWGFLMIVLGIILSFVLVGALVLLFWMVWTIVRLITGIQLAQKQQPIRDVELFGLKAV
ncbi:hypothetical protein [Hasllibacter sp. MH4015]|uniref:DUF4870 family protein n=1 Tax=Hasllibacter sp. MH4015 TaxID=2854029 RepID=UPI001CD1C5E2|nr:hypothetical protein [Hasllibacter sp. MH4015]